MSHPQLELYHSGAACSVASLLALEESGCAYTLASPFLNGTRDKAEAFLAANPAGQVPCLLVDGKPLTETSAILLYLARLVPEKRLLPLTGELFNDAKIESAVIFCSASVQPWVRQIVAPHYFMSDKSQWDQVRGLGRSKLNERLGMINQRLGDEWFYGEWSVIDGYIFWLTMNAIIQKVSLQGLERCVRNAERTLTLPVMIAAIRRAEAIEASLGVSTDPNQWGGRLSPRFAIDKMCEAMGLPPIAA